MPTYREPKVRFVSGSGSYLVDEEGKRYLDFLSGIAVTSLGHSHPAIAEAVARQARTLLHVSNLFGNALNEQVAKQIDTLMGDGNPAGGKVFFANSGTEANECAIKLARRAVGPERPGLLTALGSFHGRTLGSLAATAQPEKQAPFAPLPGGFVHVPYGDADALRKEAGSGGVGAVLLEPIQGESGVVVPPAGYLAEARAICDDFGVLLIVDEIQTGMARTGRWFAFQREGVLPDIVTLAKALGNGVPVGACWARAEVADEFERGDHGSTFGGQPLALAAVKTTIETMCEIDAPRLAEERGVQLRDLISGHEGVASVRGEGMLIGVVLEKGVEARRVAEEALELGLVVNDPVPGVIRLAPPLTLSEDEAGKGAELLLAAIRAAEERPGAVE
jgi:acetylornithine/N-succinyldiaminopimelate aminotransferase